MGAIVGGVGSLVISVFKKTRKGETTENSNDSEHGGLVHFVAMGTAIGAGIGCIYGVATVLGAFAAAAAVSSAALSLAGALGGGEHLQVAAAAISTAAFWWAL